MIPLRDINLTELDRKFNKRTERKYLMNIYNAAIVFAGAVTAITTCAFMGFALWLIFQIMSVPSTISEDGLKTVIEDVWCGDKGCSK